MAIEKLLAPRPGCQAERSEYRLEVTVVFTSPSATAAALRRASLLASQLTAQINLVVPHVVPYPLPLESPPVRLALTERRFAAIAEESPVETMVRVYLCRDRWEALKLVLRPRSLVVIGGDKSCWPTDEKGLAQKLRREGHDVVFTETE
jgi:hypothetical protein